MAKYEMKTTTLQTVKGEQTIRFPRLRIERCVELDELVEEAVRNTTYSAAEARGSFGLVCRQLAYFLAQGCSVHVEGLGRFTASLQLKEGKERETGAEGERRRNAQSIEIGGVNFGPDKEMLREMNRECRLERWSGQGNRSSTKYTAEERLEMARRFVRERGEMSLTQYCALTGLLKDKASRELRQWEREPEVSGIRAVGKGVTKKWRGVSFE